MKTLTKLLVSLCLSALFIACESATEPPAGGNKVVIKDSVLFILNEGAFGANNASLDALLLGKDSIVHNIAGNLGDGANGIWVVGDRAYVLSTGSNMLIVVDADSLFRINTVVFNLVTPNDMLIVNDSTALVTQRASNDLQFVNLKTGALGAKIEIGSGSANITSMGNRAFVSAGKDQLVVLDLASKSVIKRVTGLTDYPEYVLADSINNQIIVGTFGDWETKSKPRVFFINATTYAVTDSLEAGEQLYDMFLGKGVAYGEVDGQFWQYDLKTRKLLSAKITAPGSGLYRGIYDPLTDRIYGGEYEFSKAGKLYTFRPDGTLLGEKTAGIAPSNFAFYR